MHGGETEPGLDAAFGPEAEAAAHAPAGIAAIEAHEARLWRRCFEEANRLSHARGTPLPTSIDTIGSASVFGIEGLDSREVNRVIGLGLDGGCAPDDVSAIMDSYRRRGITRFQIEVADSALGPVEAALDKAGLMRHPDPIWVNCRTLDDLREPEPGPAVHILDATHASQVAALQRRAWGFWEPNEQLDLWFSATLERPDFTHFGVFLDGQLACVAALYVDGDMGWAGFDATRPRARTLGLRSALSVARDRRAAELGCRVLHGESYRPIQGRLGWTTWFLKSRWVPKDD